MLPDQLKSMIENNDYSVQDGLFSEFIWVTCALGKLLLIMKVWILILYRKKS